MRRRSVRAALVVFAALLLLPWMLRAAWGADCERTLADCAVRTIYVAGDGLLYIGTEYCEGLYRSPKQGASGSWEPYGAGLGYRNVMAIVPQGGRLLAGTWGAGVYQRLPGDTGWSSLSAGLGNARVQALGVGEGARPAVYAAVNPHRVYRLPYGGATWASLPESGLPSKDVKSILVAGADHVYLGLQDQGVYEFDGTRWVAKGNLRTSVRTLAADNSGGLWAGTDGGLYHWQGSGWVREAGTEGWRATALRFAAGGCLYVGLEDGRVFWREAGGGWTPGCSTGGRVWSLVVHPYRPEELYIGAQGGFYRTSVLCPRLPVSPTPVCSLKVDDFAYSYQNSLGGAVVYGAQPEPGPTFLPRYESGEAHVTYRLPAGAAGEYRSELPSLDASPYGSVSLSIKSDQPADAMDGLSIALGSQARPAGAALRWQEWATQPETDDWQAVNLPLAAFRPALGASPLISASIQFTAGATLVDGVLSLDRLRLEPSMAPLYVDNFDNADDRNALGGPSNIFTDPAKQATMRATRLSDTYDGSTTSLQLSYSVPRDNGPYAGWETTFPRRLDVSRYAALFFYLKRPTGTERCNVYLCYGACSQTPRQRFYVDLARYVPNRPGWTPVSIPLSHFGGMDLTDLAAIQFVFEWKAMSGNIQIDRLALVGDSLLVDNFCDADANTLNEKTESFQAQECGATDAIEHTIEGGALRLDFDVTQGNECNAFYVSRIHADLNPYPYLQFRVRGGRGGEVVTVSLETQENQDALDWPYKIKLSDYLPAGITTEWQTVRLPLAAYPLNRNWSHTLKFVVAFAPSRGSTSGTVWIDDTALRSSQRGFLPPLWIDNFGDGDGSNALGGGYATYGPVTPDFSDGQVHLAYDIPPGEQISWMAGFCPAVDVTAYDAFLLDVGRDGPPTGFQVCIVDDRDVERCAPVTNQGGSAAWKLLVPLSAFSGVDMTQVTDVGLRLGPVLGQTQGVLHIDNLCFAPYLPFDEHLPVARRR